MSDDYSGPLNLIPRLGQHGPWTCSLHGPVDGIWCHDCLAENERRKSEWPVLSAGWKFAGMTEMVTWQASFGGPPPREPLCDVNWGSHGCHRKRGHRKWLGHACDPCEHHPWWLHALLYRASHLFRRSSLIDRWWGGCVERRPYYGRKTRFYGEDAP